MRAPRLLTRALVTSFLTVALVLGAVFAVLSLRVRDQVRQSVADNLASAQQVFTEVEARRQQDMRASVATLAESPTLKAALDTWLTERGTANEQTSTELLATVQREANKIAERVGADVLAVADGSRRVVAAGGRLAASWPRGVGHRPRRPMPVRRAIARSRSAAACITWCRCRCSSAKPRSDRSSSAPRSMRATRASWPICRAARRRSCRRARCSPAR